VTEVVDEMADVVADIDQKAGLAVENFPGFEEVAERGLLVLMVFVVVVEVVGMKKMGLKVVGMSLMAVDMMVVGLMVGMVLHTSLTAERAADMHWMMLMVADTSPMVAQVVD